MDINYYSGDEWKTHLSTYFQQTSELVEEHGSAEKLKLCMLVLFCMEVSAYIYRSNRLLCYLIAFVIQNIHHGRLFFFLV